MSYPRSLPKKAQFLHPKKKPNFKPFSLRQKKACFDTRQPPPDPAFFPETEGK